MEAVHERKNYTHFLHKHAKNSLKLSLFIHMPRHYSRVNSFFDKKQRSHRFSQVNIVCTNLTLVEIKHTTFFYINSTSPLGRNRTNA
jgi:hypothetical protein